MTAAWPRPLVSPAELAGRLDCRELRLIECGVVYHPLPDRSDFRVESTKPLYAAGHIPGAVFTARLWWMLRAIGFDAAAVLDGGFTRWVHEGRPLTTEVPRHSPARLEPRPRPGLFVGKGTVRAAVADSRVTLVNALSAEQHAGRAA